MAENAYIKLVPSSLKQTVTVDEVKDLFQYYKEITAKTGDQLKWKYENSSFPYEIKEPDAGKGNWFYLSSNHDRYNAILVGVDHGVEDGGSSQTYVQITLPEESTYGDKGKANEFCKFLAKKLQGELQLFNGRIMYYYPRK